MATDDDPVLEDPISPRQLVHFGTRHMDNEETAAVIHGAILERQGEHGSPGAPIGDVVETAVVEYPGVGVGLGEVALELHRMLFAGEIYQPCGDELAVVDPDAYDDVEIGGDA